MSQQRLHSNAYSPNAYIPTLTLQPLHCNACSATLTFHRLRLPGLALLCALEFFAGDELGTLCFTLTLTPQALLTFALSPSPKHMQVSMVVRRLLRLFAHYAQGSSPKPPQFICCSATITSPAAHVNNLLPLAAALGGSDKLTVIDKDSSPQGTRTVAFWRPPVTSTIAVSVNKLPKRWRKGKKRRTEPVSAEGMGEDASKAGEGQEQEQEQEQEVVEAVDVAALKSSAAGESSVEGAGEKEAVTGSSKGRRPGRKRSRTDSTAAAATGNGASSSEGSAAGEACNKKGDTQFKTIEKHRSAIVETSLVFQSLVKQRCRTIAFCRTRKLSELVMKYTRDDLEASAPELLELVKGYRGGYTKADRREIETALFSERLIGCAATCALELGVDIGSLNCTCHLGFHGSVASFWQQAGRAGRGGKDSLTVLILWEDPISRIFVNNPAQLLDQPPEAVTLPACNEQVMKSHLACAAAEVPLGIPGVGDINDDKLFIDAKGSGQLLERMTLGDEPILVRGINGTGLVPRPGGPNPHKSTNLRMIDPVAFSIIDSSTGKIPPASYLSSARPFFLIG
ncbi:unnamed protein product [Chrysoparadoxa australica]